MRNIYLTHALPARWTSPSAATACPWRSQLPFALGVLAALSLAWLA